MAGLLYLARAVEYIKVTADTDLIRKAFAKANGVKPALFSAHSEAVCPKRSGAGVVYVEQGVMSGWTPATPSSASITTWPYSRMRSTPLAWALAPVQPVASWSMVAHQLTWHGSVIR